MKKEKLIRAWQWLKIRLVDFGRLVVEVITLAVGLVVFTAVAVVGVLYTFVKHVFVKRDYSFTRQLRPVVRSLTLAYDGFANACAGELLNDTQRPVVKYGKWYHTISGITGLNKMLGSELPLRRIVDGFFRLFGERRHCEDSVTDEMKCKYLT